MGVDADRRRARRPAERGPPSTAQAASSPSSLLETLFMSPIPRPPSCRGACACRSFRIPALSFGRWFAFASFCPTISALARFGLPHSDELLTSRPLSPPCMSSRKVEPGTSGGFAKVARSPPLTVSMRPYRSIDDLPSQGGNQVREMACSERDQVDVPGKRRIEQRRRSRRLAVDRVRRAVFPRPAGPGCKSCVCGSGRVARPAAG